MYSKIKALLNKKYAICIIGACFFLFVTPSLIFAQITTVKGSVIDKETNEAVPYSNVGLKGKSIGVTSDEFGVFELKYTDKSDLVVVSAVGYANIEIKVQRGISQNIKVELLPSATQLKTVTVGAGKYRNKNNPAVELIEKVIAHKKFNRLESNDYYEAKKYEKIEIDLVNISDSLRNKKWLKNFQFVFDNIDTTRVKDKRLLPAYISETASDVYFRKSPEAKKEYIQGKKQSVIEGLFDGEGLGAYLQHLYANVNIYESNIMLLNKQFVSPISGLAPTLYRFYIMDTLMVGGQRCINLAFFPRNKQDLTFIGNLYITDDSVYAVRQVKLTLPPEININFFNSMSIVQEFDKLPDFSWTMVRDETSIDFGIGDGKKGFGMWGRKVERFKDFVFNSAREKNIYSGDQNTIIKLGAKKQTEDYWLDARQERLSKSEQSVYTTIDSIKKVPDFKKFTKISSLFFSGFWCDDKIEWGPFSSAYSFNEVEGGRLRFGARTTPLFNKHFRIEGFGAYGLLDERWKYGTTLTYQFNDNNFAEKPQSALKFVYQNNTEVPGQFVTNRNEDNFLLSFRRGKNDRMYYKKTIGLSYTNENERGFMYQVGFQHMEWTPAGILNFTQIDSLGNSVELKNTYANEVYADVRFAPNEEYFQGKNRRRQIVNQYPVFGVHYHIGFGENRLSKPLYYHNLSFDVSKRFYIAPLGRTDVMFEIGRLFGKVPFPLLINHRANQTLAYQDFSYNMMNNLEFVSDKYVSFTMTHQFDGFIFNKIPIIKKLKLREVFTFRAIYGGLDDDNKPSGKTSYRFPEDSTGRKLTYTFEGGVPYMEASVGVANIFKILRVDFIKRLNYLDHPNVSEYAIRLKLRFEF